MWQISMIFSENRRQIICRQLDEFCDDFSEDEIRLVRIKFISDMAN